jgi:hypothetical protein
MQLTLSPMWFLFATTVRLDQRQFWCHISPSMFRYTMNGWNLPFCKVELVLCKPLLYHTLSLIYNCKEMTASEPLTLQEEYDMQQSWHLDDNSRLSTPWWYPVFIVPVPKNPRECTFIILAVPPPGTTSDQLKDGILSGMGAGKFRVFTLSRIHLAGLTGSHFDQ